MNQRTPLQIFVGRAVLLAAAYAVIDAIINPADTVNYELRHKKRVVYRGITYEDRFDKRMDEHEASDKVFDDCIYDDAKARHRAIKLEKKLIKRDQPKYNIHHTRG